MLYLLSWVALTLAPGPSGALLRRLVPAAFPDDFVDFQRLRWAGICLFSLLALLAYGLAHRLTRIWPAAAAAILWVHVASQLFLLRALLPSDAVAPYREPPALLAAVPAEARVVQGDFGGLFGAVTMPADKYPDTSLRWVQRQIYSELYPQAGIRWGRRYDFNLSPEGLDSFLTIAVQHAMQELPDRERLRLLAASGVSRLVIRRRLPQELERDGVIRLLAVRPTVRDDIHVYEIRGAAPEAQVVGGIRSSRHLNEAVSILADASFDPLVEVVLPGEGESTSGPRGEVSWLRREPERIELRVEVPEDGVLVVQRAYLPLYLATVDDEPSPIEVANMHRMAVRVPAGSHRVEIWVDRRPLYASFAVSGLALLALLAISRRLKEVAGGGRRR